MLARALHLLRTKPELFIAHLENYGELLRADAKQDGVRIARGLTAALLTFAALLTALNSAAFAVLLWAVHTQQWWLLWAVPLVSAGAAVVGWKYLRRVWIAPALPRVRRHIARDFASMRHSHKAGDTNE